MLQRLLTLALTLSTLGNGPVTFVDATKQAGILWTHENGKTPDKYLIETMGGGAAFLDYDNDGRLDIYLVNSGAHKFSTGISTARNVLYRNNGDATFDDVTARARVAGKGYGNGVAAGDFDNDGWVDLYVTCFGSNILYRNKGDGTFEDVTEKAGVAVGKWSTSAAFFDYDNDGDLDLFVCIYLTWSYDANPWCGERREGYRSYCHPDFFEPIPNVLFRNNGDGTFTDVTRQAGVDQPGKGLGVVTGDMNGDGFADIYVANDAVANFFFHNRGDGTFEETALLSEIAYGSAAKPESGMGADMGDFDGDGRLDLIVTNIDYEMNNLYSNSGEGYFDNQTVPVGMGESALRYSGFGVRFLDFDNDGDLDLAVLNGHPLDNIELYRDGVTGSEHPLIFENLGKKFEPVGDRLGEIWQRRYNGRALAAGDYDNDGDVDLLFVNNGEAPLLARNDGGNRNPWIGFRLEGSTSNRDAVGARVTVTTDQRRLMRERTGGGSYQAAHDPRLLFGLRPEEKLQSIEIRWPGGKVQVLEPLELRKYHTVRE